MLNIHRFAPCYETATTRAFYNGRTETMRPCTVEVTNWVKAMLRSDVQVLPLTNQNSVSMLYHCSNVTSECYYLYIIFQADEKVKLLQIAAKKHDKLMKEAREGCGCDRYMFGLYCISEENQIPVPELFTDPSYVKR